MTTFLHVGVKGRLRKVLTQLGEHEHFRHITFQGREEFLEFKRQFSIGRKCPDLIDDVGSNPTLGHNNIFLSNEHYLSAASEILGVEDFYYFPPVKFDWIRRAISDRHVKVVVEISDFVELYNSIRNVTFRKDFLEVVERGCEHLSWIEVVGEISSLVGPENIVVLDGGTLLSGLTQMFSEYSLFRQHEHRNSASEADLGKKIEEAILDPTRIIQSRQNEIRRLRKIRWRARRRGAFSVATIEYLVELYEEQTEILRHNSSIQFYY